MIDWNDPRYFLAVARYGSTLAAGRVLRVSQTTVARRVAALEAELGLTLFERRPAGYILTPVGVTMQGKMQDVEEAIGSLADAAAAQIRDVSGTVRVTAEEIFAVSVLSPILRDLHDAYPKIRIELDTVPGLRDLAAGGADVALRSSEGITGGGLVGRRIAYDAWTVYCSREYAATHGAPRTIDELRGHPLVGGGPEGVWRLYRKWLIQHGLEDAVVLEHGTATGLLATVRAGFGLTILPCFVADLDDELVRCLPPAPGNKRGLWLLTHERLRHTPRIRAVLDFLAERLAALARQGAARHSKSSAGDHHGGRKGER